MVRCSHLASTYSSQADPIQLSCVYFLWMNRISSETIEHGGSRLSWLGGSALEDDGGQLEVAIHQSEAFFGIHSNFTGSYPTALAPQDLDRWPSVSPFPLSARDNESGACQMPSTQHTIHIHCSQPVDPATRREHFILILFSTHLMAISRSVSS